MLTPNFGAAEAFAGPHSTVNSDWAQEVEGELFAEGKSVTIFDVTAPAGTGTKNGDPLSMVGSSTTPTFEELREEIEASLDIPTHRSCNTIVEEDNKFVEEDEDEDEGEIRPKEEMPLSRCRDVNDEWREHTAPADPLVGTGFGVDDLGYPLHACKDPTAAFLESVAKDDDVSSLVIVDPETLDGGYVMVDMTGMCVTPEGVEVGKHRDLLRRWKSAMKRGFSNAPILVSSKVSPDERGGDYKLLPPVRHTEHSSWQAPSKYHVSNSNYAKHKAQFYSVVCVTVVQSVETITR